MRPRKNRQRPQIGISSPAIPRFRCHLERSEAELRHLAVSMSCLAHEARPLGYAQGDNGEARGIRDATAGRSLGSFGFVFSADLRFQPKNAVNWVCSLRPPSSSDPATRGRRVSIPGFRASRPGTTGPNWLCLSALALSWCGFPPHRPGRSAVLGPSARGSTPRQPQPYNRNQPSTVSPFALSISILFSIYHTAASGRWQAKSPQFHHFPPRPPCKTISATGGSQTTEAGEPRCMPRDIAEHSWAAPGFH